MKPNRCWIPAAAVLALLACSVDTPPQSTAAPPVPALEPATAEPRAAIVNTLASGERLPGDAEEDTWRKPEVVLEMLGVGPDMRVLDVFAAGGYYVELLSRIVGRDGTVIAYNNVPYAEFAAAKIEERYRGGRLPNVRQLTVEPGALALEPGELDAALFVMAYHDLYWHPADGSWPEADPDDFLRRLYLALKPGGVVLVQDHIAAPGDDTREIVDRLHRIDPAVVKADFLRAGFEFSGEHAAYAHPDDDHTRLVFDEAVRHRTDQFLYRFVKPLRSLDGPAE